MLDEEARYRLHQRLAAVLGPEEAGTLMASLPPEEWRELATRRDLESQGAALRSDLARQGAELRSEMAELRGELRAEMAELRGELRAEMAELRGELRAEMAELGTDVVRELRAQTWRLAALLVPSIVAVAGLAVAAPHI